MTYLRLAVAGLVLVLLPGFVLAQGLGEAARREKERRAGKKPPARVYGDQDLGSGSAPREADSKAARDGAGGPSADGAGVAASQASSTSSSGTSTAAAAAADDAEAKARARDEESWRARAYPLREAYQYAERRVKQLEARVAEAEREGQKQAFIYGVPGTAAAHARRDLEQASKDLVAAAKAWEDFQDEARRAGVPPGWLR